MDIIERLNDPEAYVDAVDDAISEIEELRSKLEREKAEHKATLEKYESDLIKLWHAVGQPHVDVDGGYIETVCAELRYLQSGLTDIRDLARTGLPISGYTTSEWDTYRIHKIAGLANEALERGAK